MARIRKLLWLAAIALSSIGGAADAAVMFLKARLDGAQAGVSTSADGSAFLTYDTVPRQLTWTVNYRNLSSAGTAAHIHGPAAPGVSAGIQVGLTFGPSPLTGSATITPAQEADMLAGLYYINIHTANFPNGEIRGQIAVITDNTYKAPMDGTQAGTPGSPIPTSGTGGGTVTFDAATRLLSWNLTFANLTSPVNGAHFHGPAQLFEVAGIRVGTGIVPPVTGSTTLSTALAAELVNGFCYYNVHTNNFPNGEIRGQVLPIHTLTVTLGGGGSGTVTSPAAPANPGATGISCQPNCTAEFDEGATVVLTATPAAGSYFAGWTSGGCVGLNPVCSIRIASTSTVNALFNTGTAPARLVNISTRGDVLTGFDQLIGGFVVAGPGDKTVIIRAIGPSLTNFGVAGALANPTLDLVRISDSTVIATNDDWQAAGNAQQIAASGFAPTNSLESAILTTLPPGPYGAIVSGVGNTTGVGLVEIYEVDRPEVPLANISTRGHVGSGASVLIGGFVVNGNGSQTVVVRAIGPSLANFGVTSALSNPALQIVRMSDQAVIATNDDWQTDPNAAQVSSRGFAPTNPLESAIFITLPPGAYGAIVSGVGGATGTALVEVYTTQ